MPRRPDALFLTEAEIAARVGRSVREWQGIAAVLERDGLPCIDPLMGGRYWPAVQAFFDRRHGLRKDTVQSQSDGVETWANNRRRA